MKKLRFKLLCLLLGGAAFTVAPRADAIPLNITNAGGSLVSDVSKGDLANNNISGHLSWLGSQVSGYNTITSSSLPAPTGGVDASAGIGGSINVSGYTYATLQYGKGPGGIGQGGSVVAYDLNGTTSFTFPQNGLGPNGMGGLALIYLFGPISEALGPTQGVPDDGSTAFFLIVATLMATVLKRRLKAE